MIGSAVLTQYQRVTNGRKERQKFYINITHYVVDECGRAIAYREIIELPITSLYMTSPGIYEIHETNRKHYGVN